MIFRQWQQVLDGAKTQTRRLVKNGDYTWLNPLVFPPEITEVCGLNQVRWTKGKTYAIQPGRGQKAVGRIHITEIRRERLQEISEEDAIAEGIYNAGDFGWSYHGTRHYFLMAISAFRDLWDSIHKKPGTRFADNPEVWVLMFELTGES